MKESKNNNSGSVFSQPNWQVSGDVYNVAGDLILSKDSSTQDLIKSIEDLKDDIANLEGLEIERKGEIDGDLDAVVREVGREKPSKGIVVSRLNTAQATLEAVKDTAKGAWDLAKVIANISGWAAAFFA